jgi:O-antigen ligase
MLERTRMLPLITGAAFLPVFFLPFTPEDPFLVPKGVFVSFLACISFFLLFYPSRSQLSSPSGDLILSSFIFLGCMAVSIPGSSNPHAGISEMMRWVYLIIIFFSATKIAWGSKRLSTLLSLSLAISALVAISALLEYIKIVPFYLYPFDGGRRIFSFFGYPNIMAQYLIIIVLWGLGLTLSSDRKITKGFAIVCTLLSMAALLVTFSRGAILATVTGGLFFAFAYLKAMGLTGAGKIKIAVALALLVTALVIAGTVSDSVTGGKTFEQVADMFQRADSYRFMLWDKTVEIFSLHPVTGTGLGNFQIRWYVYAHNEVLQMLVETGIIGLSGFLIFMAVLSKKIKQYYQGISNRKLKIMRLGVVAGFVATLVQSMFSFNLHSATSSFFFFLGAGILCSEPASQTDLKSTPGTSSAGKKMMAFCIAASISILALGGEYKSLMAHYFYSQALLYGKQNKVSLSLESSLKAVQYQPHIAKYHRLAGNMYWKQGQTETAKDHFQKALELSVYY